MKINKKYTALAAAIWCMVGSWSALAALPVRTVPDGVSNDSGIQMNRMQQYLERERVQRQIAEDRAAQKAKVEQEQTKANQQEENIHFALKKIDTGSSAVLSAEEIAAVTKPYEGKDVTIADMYAVIEKINALYQQKGYMTCRAFLQPQTVENGVVKLLLIEGKTGTYTVQGNQYTRGSYIQNRLHLAAGEVANIKQVNDDMLRFNASNSTQLRIVMKAGKQPGTTDYEIMAYEPQRETWTLFEDNAGSDTSGQYRTGLFYTTKSLSGTCDPLSVGTVFSEGMKAANLTYSHYLGRCGTKMNLLYSTNAVKTVDGAYKDKVKGHANSFTLGFTHPLLVNETTRSELSLDYNHQTSKSDFIVNPYRFNIVDDAVQDVSLGLAVTKYGNSHVYYQKHSYVRGYRKSTPDTHQAETQHFGFYKFNGLYQKSYAAGRLLSMRADAQWSGTDGLSSSRQFYIGGMYSVRGYKENYLGGDSGFTFSTEYQVPVFNSHANAFAFFDYGHIYGSGQSDDAARILASTGLGLRCAIGKNMSASLTLGVPLRREFPAETVSKTRLHFVVSGQF